MAWFPGYERPYNVPIDVDYPEDLSGTFFKFANMDGRQHAVVPGVNLARYYDIDSPILHARSSLPKAQRHPGIVANESVVMREA